MIPIKDCSYEGERPKLKPSQVIRHLVVGKTHFFLVAPDDFRADFVAC